MTSEEIRQAIETAINEHIGQILAWTGLQLQEFGPSAYAQKHFLEAAWPVLLATKVEIVFDGDVVAHHTFYVKVADDLGNATPNL